MSKRYKRVQNIKSSKWSLHLNIGVIIFLCILLYISINGIIYVTRQKVSIYEITNGKSEITKNIITTGVAIRSENVINADTSGYINFYSKEGSRVKVNDIIYTIDESGTLSKLLNDAIKNNQALDSKNISEMKEDINDFVTNFDNKNFSEVYDFKYIIESDLIENINISALDTINQSLSLDGGNAVSINRSTLAGYVQYYTDGYESINADALTKDLFDETKYKKNTIINGDSIESGKPVLKIINSEEWKIAFELTDSQYNEYKDYTAVDVYFPSEKIKTSAYFEIKENNGSKYGVIKLSRYISTFLNKRYIDIEILGDTVKGLKVPKTAVIEKEFYTIPKDYMTYGGNSDDSGFQVETVKDSETLVKFVSTDIVATDENYCYIDTENNDIKKGDILVKPDSQERYQIATVGKLKGVYNVNTGYTVFRYIHILSEKNDYYIVESDTKYGLQIYDQIILNASLVKSNQVIFK